ncbi:RnfABCDGE type electron transport complex subunit D [Marinifilum caeruleilacunae]|jgi:electron transport complex protein RnfD|uniref:Ion-translocating oxidoreductase complex subunit D n=1 Tax=Marinifilum caeruleilacunae TaxID=2499076 RepID=A0ABX1WTK7_9BACT|nr:RnfABCDGE type electron transport complex subunit D [Marinifilum caeruleilacunae]NOU59417.1 RnfABCDGE type electron transport complex subunit D [Marinifilum caeruleilacunae]
MNTKVLVAPSPHVHSGDSIQKNMYGVVFAMLPALLFSFFYFGLGALVVTLTAVASCYLFEFLIQKYILQSEVTINDGSALITGILLAFNVPSNLPIWIIIIGALVSIGIGKMTFGGLGNNVFNPALVGRVFLLISFPVQMTSWPKPTGLSSGYIDVETGATPLAIIKEGLNSGQPLSKLMSEIPSNMDLFLGNMGGSMGEIAGAALVLGLIYMLIRKIITWHIPVSVIGSVAIFTGILHMVDPEAYAGPLFHILTGGLLLGGIFMATDYVTSPMSNKGMIIYGIGIGVLTVVIRVFGAYPEGVSFAILIMNAFVPLINVYVKPKRFGEKRK